MTEQKQKTSPLIKVSERNYGIDLLRILSMLMIVTLHVLKQGGILDHVNAGTYRYTAAWLLEALSIGAVNIYAMISGFVGVNAKKTRFYKLADMWLQVELYCVISAVLIYLCEGEPFEFERLFNRLAPFSTNAYWYFTAYFMMFFFVPFYNRLLDSLSESALKYLGLIIFLFSSLWPTLWQEDLMQTNRGYSFLWLSLLYILGGIANRLQLHKKVNGFGAVAAYAVLAAAGVLFLLASEKYHLSVKDPELLICYYSANIVAGSFCLLLAAAKTDIKAKAPVKIIKALSPLTFGVYIIHTSEYVWRYMLKDAFAAFADMRAPVLVLAVIGTVLAIYLICSAIDGVRLFLFRLLRIESRLCAAEGKLRAAIHKKKAVRNENKS